MLSVITELYKPLLDFILLITLAMARIYAIFLLLPIFSNKIITGLSRTGIVIVFAAFVTPTINLTPQAQVQLFSAYFLIILVKEVMIGVIMGFVLSMFFWIMEGVGTLIDIQSGANNSTTFDPLSNHEAGPFTGLLLQIVLIVFVVSGGLLIILKLIFESYKIWPILDFYPSYNQMLITFVIQQSDNLLVSIVKFSAPILVILLLIEFGLGLVAKSAQQLHVFDLSQPIKFYSSIILLTLFLPYFYDSLSTYMLDISKFNSLFSLMEGSKLK